MVTLSTILIIVACVMFGMAAFNVASSRFNLVAAGLFFWSLSLLLGGVLKFGG